MQSKGLAIIKKNWNHPGMIMCLITAAMLIADFCVPSMKNLQFYIYPLLFRLANFILLLIGIFNVALAIRKGSLQSASLFGKKRSIPLGGCCFAAFAALVILSTAENGLTREAVFGIPHRNIGMFDTLMLLAAYFAFSLHIKEEESERTVLAAFLAIADVLAVTALISEYAFEIAAYTEKKDLSAIFFNGNHYGYFLVMAVLAGFGIFLFEKGKLRFAGAASAALNLIVLLINHSMGCLLAVVIVSITTLIMLAVREPGRRKSVAVIFALLAAVIILALCVSPALRAEVSTLVSDTGRILSHNNDGSIGHNRMKQWLLTLGLIKQKPLIGYGCEGIAFFLYNKLGVSNPHSELLTYAAYYGIPAAVLYTAGVIAVIVRHLRNGSESAVSSAACMAASGYFISSLVGTAMFYTTPFFFVFMGITLNNSNRNI